MRQQMATVLYNRPLGAGHRRLGLRASLDAWGARPGQFVMLRVGDRLDPLLRRPFSVHRLLAERGRPVGLELLYRVVGRGTAILAGCRQGDRLDLLGPLGRGFSLPEGLRRAWVVGGGIGVAPLLMLAEAIVDRIGRPEDCHVFLGARAEEELLCREDFRALGVRLTLTTDDGSAGDQCLVTHPVEAALVDGAPEMLYACGPVGMLACVAGIARRRGIPCQVSLEAHMACGLGACLGCAVPARGEAGGFLHACMDGPVFDIEQIAL